MHRQIIAYLPATAIPALVWVAMITAYTRLLSPHAYGDYALAFSATMIAQATLFTPLGLAVIRLYPQAEAAGTLPGLLASAYGVLGILGAVLCAVGLLSYGAGLTATPLLAVALLALRGAVTVNQSVNRMQGRVHRYTAIECGQAMLGLGTGVLLVVAFDLGSCGVVAGLAIGSGACLLADRRLLLAALQDGRAAWGPMAGLLRFGWPLGVAFLAACLLQYVDRFVLGAFDGAGSVAIYAVAFALVERPTTLLCMTVSTATFPLAVRALETDGTDAARMQAGRNGLALLAVVVPACTGLALLATPIAAVLVGPAYRDGVAALIPVMACTALARGLCTHFAEHAFHLAQRPTALLPLYGGAAAATLALDFVTIPLAGAQAAAWTGLGCQTALLGAAWVSGRRFFPLSLPRFEAGTVLVAASAMALVLLGLGTGGTIAGLVLAVIAGAFVYGAALLMLHARSMLRRIVPEWAEP